MDLLGKRKLNHVCQIVRRWLWAPTMPVRRAEVSHGGQPFWCRVYIGGVEMPVYLYVNYKTGEVYVPEHPASVEWSWLEGMVAGIGARRIAGERWAAAQEELKRQGLDQLMQAMNTKRVRIVDMKSFRHPWENPNRREEREEGRA